MASKGVMLSLLGFQTPVFYLWVTQHRMMDVDLVYVTSHPYWTPCILKSIKGAAVHFRKQISYFTKSVLMYGVNFFCILDFLILSLIWVYKHGILFELSYFSLKWIFPRESVLIYTEFSYATFKTYREVLILFSHPHFQIVPPYWLKLSPK